MQFNFDDDELRIIRSAIDYYKKEFINCGVKVPEIIYSIETKIGEESDDRLF